MNAQQAIDTLNAHRCLLPPEELSDLLKILSRNYAQGDADAIRWLWLLNWKPPKGQFT